MYLVTKLLHWAHHPQTESEMKGDGDWVLLSRGQRKATVENDRSWMTDARGSVRIQTSAEGRWGMGFGDAMRVRRMMDDGIGEL